MATGYTVAGRGDLDGLFAPRVSAPAGATGYKSNGGVDLNQRFEPRGGAAPIADTNYRVAGTDLAQIFKNIASGPSTSHNMVAGLDSLSSRVGFQLLGGASDCGSLAPQATGAFILDAINWTTGGGSERVTLHRSSAGATPADDDTSFQRIEVAGVFSTGGASPRTLTRSARSSLVDFTFGGTLPGRTWVWSSNNLVGLIVGNTYAVNLYRT